MKLVMSVFACIVLALAEATAQQPQPPCRALCAPELTVEPTFTMTNLLGSPRVEIDNGPPTPERRETEFELIVSVDLPSRISWLGFTVEAIFLPFERDSTPALEFEANFTWLPSKRTGGWLSSHVDVVDLVFVLAIAPF